MLEMIAIKNVEDITSDRANRKAKRVLHRASLAVVAANKRHPGMNSPEISPNKAIFHAARIKTCLEAANCFTQGVRYLNS